MRRLSDYLKYAQECRDLAAMMPPAHRGQLLEMARQWEILAEERRRTLSLTEPPSFQPPAQDPSF